MAEPTTPKHTPVPMPVYVEMEFDDEPAYLFDANGEELGEFYTMPDGQARAAFVALIVKAVNRHQGLVEALRYALECLDEVKADEPSYHFYHYGDVSVDAMARAALKQVEED